MKKYILSLLSVFLIFSCTDEDYESVNQDPINPSNVNPEFLYSGATKALFNHMVSTNVNVNIFRLVSQYWTETSYVDESNYDLNRRSIPDRHMRVLYENVLFDLKDAKGKVEGSPLSVTFTQEVKNNQVAVTEILSVYTWQILVDTFGNIPYSDGLLGQDNLSPAYEDAAQIYTKLLERIDTAISQISQDANGFGNADLVYNGDMVKWYKFANSVKLKLAMRLSDVNPAVAQQAAESVYQNVLQSNADNFSLTYLSTTPNTNPLWVDLVQSGRADFVAANTVVDYMNTLEDPRRPVYFAENLGSGTFSGGIYGDNNSYSSYSHVGSSFHEPIFPGTIMDYSEIQFLLAEAAARGWSVGGTVEEYYNNAITASFDFWGLSSTQANEYLSRNDVNYATATGDWRQKIGFQFWLAMYNRGFEGWSVWRKYNAPQMNTAAESGLPVPKRFTYPINEQNLNYTNYLSASQAIGGDEQQTAIFWDVN